MKLHRLANKELRSTMRPARRRAFGRSNLSCKTKTKNNCIPRGFSNSVVVLNTTSN